MKGVVSKYVVLNRASHNITLLKIYLAIFFQVVLNRACLRHSVTI